MTTDLLTKITQEHFFTHMDESIHIDRVFRKCAQVSSLKIINYANKYNKIKNQRTEP